MSGYEKKRISRRDFCKAAGAAALLRGPDTPGAVSGVTEIWTAVGAGYEGFEIR